MTEQKKEKPKKIAYVVSGRSLLTKIGCANAGAKVTPAMMASANPNAQKTAWYNQIRDGVLELPKTLKSELKEAEKTNEQITLEDFFAPPSEEADGEGADGEGADGEGADGEGAGEEAGEEAVDKKTSKRPRGAKRK